MSSSNETDILLKELEEASSQALDIDDSSVLDNLLGTEDVATADVQAPNIEEKSGENLVCENTEEQIVAVNPASESAEEQSADAGSASANVEEQSTHINSASENIENQSEDTNSASESEKQSTNLDSVSEIVEEQSANPEDAGKQNEPDNTSSNAVVVTELLEAGNDVEMSDAAETFSAAESTGVPEIVPNSEMHVSEIPTASEDCNIISVSFSEDADTTPAQLEVKEEIIDDTEVDPDTQVQDSNASFNVSPSFVMNLDPKFKPTIMLEKIDASSGKIKQESGEGHTFSENDNTVETVSSDEENSKDSSKTSRRPKRSIKTPRHLAKGFVLDDTNKKAGKNVGSVASSKTPGKNVSSHGTPVRIIKSNFVPIKPKPAGSNVEIAKKSPNITIVKYGQEAKSPVARPNSSDEAMNIVRSLNAKSVPSILNRSKRPAEQVSPVSSSDSTNTSKAAPAKKQKVEPPKETPKKPQRRHRKIFDYESYLREHLEAEVNDKKPKSSDINGEPFQLLSSLVGVNVPSSKIKVMPFSKNATAALKSKKANENDSNNAQTKRTDRTLYDLMQDISLLLPSWNLHIMPDSNTFCIAQVCRSRSGIPTLKTSIELDSQFNGKVFIHQLHCKRYDGVYDSEESISALIQEIDALSK